MRYFDLRPPPVDGLRSVAYKEMKKFLVSQGFELGALKFPESFGRKDESIRLFERRLSGCIAVEAKTMILSLLNCLHESGAVEVGVASVDFGSAKLYIHVNRDGEYIGHMIAVPRKSGGYSFV